MRFYKCNCGFLWLPKKEEMDYSCPSCKSTETKPLPDTTVYQCKNRSSSGVILLDCDGSGTELKYSWEEFNILFEYVDTEMYWAKKTA